MSSVFKHDVAACPYCGEVSTFDVDGRIQLEPEVVDFTSTDWERITSTRAVDPDTKEIIAIRCRACAGHRTDRPAWGGCGCDRQLRHGESRPDERWLG